MKLYAPVDITRTPQVCAVTAAALTTMFRIGLNECAETIAREIAERGRAWDD